MFYSLVNCSFGLINSLKPENLQCYKAEKQQTLTSENLEPVHILSYSRLNVIYNEA